MPELNSIFNGKFLCIEEKYKEFVDKTNEHIITGHLDKAIKNLTLKEHKLSQKIVFRKKTFMKNENIRFHVCVLHVLRISWPQQALV